MKDDDRKMGYFSTYVQVRHGLERHGVWAPTHETDQDRIPPAFYLHLPLSHSHVPYASSFRSLGMENAGRAAFPDPGHVIAAGRAMMQIMGDAYRQQSGADSKPGHHLAFTRHLIRRGRQRHGFPARHRRTVPRDWEDAPRRAGRAHPGYEARGTDRCADRRDRSVLAD